MRCFNLNLIRSLTFSSGLSAGVALLVSAPQAAIANEASGNIKFTADNAAEVFLNGKSLGQTQAWTSPYDFQDLELLQGKNVSGIAAWDSEGIAAMSGQFNMPDGTTFGSTNYEEWLVFPADKSPKSSNSAGNPFDKSTQDPLSVYKEILDIPPGWNEIDYTVSDFANKSWIVPG